MEYLFKVEIELDDEKIVSEDRYELADVYVAIRKVFEHKNIPEIKTDSHILVFATKKHEKYGYIWAGVNSVYFSAVKPYITKIMWYNREHGEDYYENVLATYRKRESERRES